MTPEEEPQPNILQMVHPEGWEPPKPTPPPEPEPPPTPPDLGTLLNAFLTKVAALLGNHPELEACLADLGPLLKPSKPTTPNP